MTLTPRRHLTVACILTAFCLGSTPAPALARTGVVVGSKAFPESWVLAEALARVLRSEGVPRVEHRNNLGGTEIVYQALRAGDVDAYPEYTGTIAQVILHRSVSTSLSGMRRALSREGIGVSDPLGFNDSYALAVTKNVRERYRLESISDLARHPELKLGLTHEFLGRPDGWPGLVRHYGLSMPHVLGIQLTGVEPFAIVYLSDDRGFFPRYDAVWLYRLDLGRREPRAVRAMHRLTGRIDEAAMIRANARVVLGHRSYGEAADSLLAETLPSGQERTPAATNTLWGGILRNTGRHLSLVLISLLLAVLAGIPLGVLAARSPWLGSAILSVTGLLQTIPSLALLAALIPLFGIGAVPALIALFLYSLLPIVRNTYVGLTTLPGPLAEAADAIGLSPRAQLLRVRLPMASPAIMAGIKTSAVINVGTATLAALIGAGGLGEPILSGIQLRQGSLILQGAVPAALLALLVQRAFDLVDRVAIPRGLRLPPSPR